MPYLFNPFKRKLYSMTTNHMHSSIFKMQHHQEKTNNTPSICPCPYGNTKCTICPLPIFNVQYIQHIAFVIYVFMHTNANGSLCQIALPKVYDTVMKSPQIILILFQMENCCKITFAINSFESNNMLKTLLSHFGHNLN